MVDRSKQGMMERGELVLKRHESIQTANLEIQIARHYTNQQISLIRIPKYGEPFVEGSLVYLPSNKVKGESLMDNNNLGLTIQLVRDLALFHELYAQSKKDLASSVIYRDAIMSNFLLVDGEIVHLDFTSSNRFVHCFDDLALLLNKSWNNVPQTEVSNLVNLYIRLRSKFRELGVRAIGNLDQNLVGNKEVSDRLKHYTERISAMASSGIDTQGLDNLFSGVDFRTMDRKDFSAFSTFREIRAKYYLQKVWGGPDEN